MCLCGGFVYVAFVIDTFADRTVGLRDLHANPFRTTAWRVSGSAKIDPRHGLEPVAALARSSTLWNRLCMIDGQFRKGDKVITRTAPLMVCSANHCRAAGRAMFVQSLHWAPG
jgi:hypothetical protein